MPNDGRIWARGCFPLCFVTCATACGASGSDATNGVPLDASLPVADGASASVDAADDVKDSPVDAGTDTPIDAGHDAQSGPIGDYPYPASNYDEPYRAQFHFTPPAGWLNDANGMWFVGGTYHFTYQSYAYSLLGDSKDWGHATSTDLVHWASTGLMLEADTTLGEAWSGSTVVDTANTSGLQTGTNPVLVTLYTCTAKGTCLSYSNDNGATWAAYANNPVAIGGPTSDTRDPHVFWHTKTNQWVCAHYDKGIVFYTSPDLKTWTRRTQVAFGFECPDIYELPVDGKTSSTKWVLQDASGSYLLGQFDGTTFKADSSFGPDSNGTYKPQAMDVGTSFYASQTYFRPTFPSTRVVQMAWLRGPETVTAPWNQAISFPAEIALVTTSSGVRVTRAPITEIATIYGAQTHFGATTLAAGQNLFAGLASKAMDFEVTLDASSGTAKVVTFRIADFSFVYDVAAQTLLGKALALKNGKVTIRVLADHGQLEVFANGGLYSYSAAQFFAPDDASLSLSGDGTTVITSADFRQVNRIWPGTAAVSSAITDDGSSSVTYTGAWTTSNEARYYGGGCHVGSEANGTIEATFTGTRIDWYGLKNVDLGKADIYIDDTLVAARIDLYDPRRQNARLFSMGGLTSGPHTIKVAVAGLKNPASAGTALVHDYFVTYVDP